MKKILASLLLVFGLVFLVACQNDDNNGGDIDTEKPVIMGADPVTITVGTPFDPLEGVTATDNVDGTITLTMANVTGTVNVDEPGTYTLTYTVKDKAGNEAVKTRVITVVPEAPLGNIVDGDFTNLENLDDNQGWYFWADTSEVGGDYKASYEIKDGVVIIDIQGSKETDTQWWGVQLQYNAIVLKQFESYKLRFRIKADAERYMNHQIQGGGIPGGKAYGENNFVKITTEWQVIEKDFYVLGDATNAQLQLAFGNFGEATGVPEEYRKVFTKIYIDFVEIVAGPELENQAPSITADNIVVKVGQPTPIRQGISVSDDFTQLQVSDLVVTQKEGETPFNPQNPAKGVYTFTITAEDDEGLTTTVTRTITVAEPWNRPTEFEITADGGWVFEVPPTGWFIRQVDLVNDEPWLTYEDKGNGEVSVTIDKIAAGDWQASYRVGDLQLFAGTYTITFEAKADVARKIRVALEGAALADEIAYQDILISTEWTEITLVYEVTSDQFNKGLDFWFGTLTTKRGDLIGEASDDILTTVHFRNLNVQYEE